MQRHGTERPNQPAAADLEQLVRERIAEETAQIRSEVTAEVTARLQDEMTALREEMQRMLAERDDWHLAGNAPEVAPVVAPARMTAPRDGDGDGETTIAAEAVPGDAHLADGVSRRRLFGLLGGAAAAGAGLAVAGSALDAHRADAADGNNLVIGVVNSNNNPGGGTSLTGSTASSGTMLSVSNTASSGVGVVGFSSSGRGVWGESDSSIGVLGDSTSGNGVLGSSLSSTGVFGSSSTGNSLRAGTPDPMTAGAHLLLDRASDAGPPAGGAHTLGQFWLDSTGRLWQCVVAGTPGTWVDLTSGSKLVAVNPPARVLDTRSSGGPISSGQTRAVTVAGLMGVPAGVSAVLTNLTATGANAAGFLAMVAHGAPPPSTSNLNLIPNQDLANNATSAVASNQVDVSCGGPVSAVNFIVDVFGYYP